MVYRKVQENTHPSGGTHENRISYLVCEDEETKAEFSYRIESRRQDGVSRFWIDEIRLFETHGGAFTMEAVLQFIQYKCQTAGCPAMFVRLDQKNLFYIDLYQKFGFYLIDQEERELSHGQVCCESVLKYPVPASKDEVFRSYILRSERKRAKTQPK